LQTEYRSITIHDSIGLCVESGVIVELTNIFDRLKKDIRLGWKNIMGRELVMEIEQTYYDDGLYIRTLEMMKD